ncbi:MAG: hypothetical protein Kow0092_38670 [Deferrisomatales bacterium]
MKTLHIDELPLQPLRIPEGWCVDYNQFFDVEPGADVRLLGSASDDVWQLFGEDMLLLSHGRHGYQVDMGWYPDSDPSGRFRIRLVHGDEWDRPIMEFETSDKREAVRYLEEILKEGAKASISY